MYANGFADGGGGRMSSSPKACAAAGWLVWEGPRFGGLLRSVGVG